MEMYSSVTQKKAIIIGASSGIGRALAHVLSKHGYELGLAARRTELLNTLQLELPNKSYVKTIDVSKAEEAMGLLKELIAQMQGCGLIVIAAGVGFDDHCSIWAEQKEMIDVNVRGFAAMATVALEYFIKEQQGILVGISSVLSLRGSSFLLTYAATKAFIANLLQGIRAEVQARKLPIYVIDIKPGRVDTNLRTRINGKSLWMCSPEKAGEDIYKAIVAKKKVAYITKRWRVIGWILKYAPDWFIHILFSQF